ncbi:MAG: hypothetical protein ACREDY_21070, partial [Bradyrhizobium sp.]
MPRPYELSVRELAVGGEVIDVVKWRGASPYLCPRLLILVHGFNLTQDRAAEALAGFHRRLASNARSLPPAWRFYWPGDHEIPQL